MMKKNWLMRVSMLALCVLLISSVVVCGTFAKYTWTGTGIASTEVAQFAFEVNGIAVDGTNTTIDVNLFNTINDTDGTTAETDVATGKIAPGTSGEFALSVKNTGEVNVNYTIALTSVTLSGVPIQISVDNGTNWITPEVDNDMFTGTSNMNAAAAGSGTVKWKWAIGDGTTDTADTALGFAGSAQPSLTFSVNVTQVD